MTGKFEARAGSETPAVWCGFEFGSGRKRKA